MSDEHVGVVEDQEMELLKRLVREHLNVDAATDSRWDAWWKSRRIPWSTISKRIGKRSRLSFQKWQKNGWTAAK
jgi:hypothetical protein